MTMDLDIVMVIFYQRFLWRFQKHITLGVFIVFWKNRNLKQESHLNLHCWSIWYFLNPPPPVLFPLNDPLYFTTTSSSKFNDATLPTNTISVLSTYSPIWWIVALVTILPRQITSVAGVPRPSLVTYHFPLISCHHTPTPTILLSEPLILLEREPLISPETNLKQKIFCWKGKMTCLVTSWKHYYKTQIYIG